MAGHTGRHSDNSRAYPAARVLVVCIGDSSDRRRNMASQKLRLGGKCMRIIVIKLPACISRFLMKLRIGVE